MKPDWKDAPGWASFVAQDGDGEWVWHEFEPYASIGVWVSAGRKWYAGFELPPCGPLEPRP